MWHPLAQHQWGSAKVGDVQCRYEPRPFNMRSVEVYAELITNMLGEDIGEAERNLGGA